VSEVKGVAPQRATCVSMGFPIPSRGPHVAPSEGHISWYGPLVSEMKDVAPTEGHMRYYGASYTEQRTSCGPFRGPHLLVWASRVRSEGCGPHRGPHALLWSFLYRAEDIMWPPQGGTCVSMQPLVSEVKDVAPTEGHMHDDGASSTEQRTACGPHRGEHGCA
jgi:hypothetical protein